MARAKPTYVLGTGLSHDGSSCLLRDGRVAVAIEKERLTRRKHDGMNDATTIAYCLEAEGIGFDELALVVQNANFSVPDRRWFHGARPIPEHVPLVTISHHLAHAYSAAASSPFDEAAVLVVDGCGNAYRDCIDLDGAEIAGAPPPGLEHLYFEKDSFYRFEGGRVRPVFKDFSPWGLGLQERPLRPETTMHSIGGVYGAASVYALLGMEDPGKLMGLAPYGRPGAHEFEIFELRDGRVFVRYDWMDRFDRPSRGADDFRRRFEEYADLAYWVQREVERALLHVVHHRAGLCDSDNLAYAGGVALNAVANRRLLAEGPFRRLYVQPAAGDAGLALGCAHYGWLEVLGRERVRHDGSTCLGRVYPSDAITQLLHDRADALRVEEPADLVDAAAERLAAGLTVAWFRGGSELGPRALGHRSILADPRVPDMRDRINRDIKRREDFRPFAASVPREDVARYFDPDVDSPYMLLVVQVQDAWRQRLPSIVHCDASCRIQTVSADDDPEYHALHRAFERRTGISALLNTSLNRRGMPIVETPAQALELFLSSALDVLVIGPYLVGKRPASAAAPTPARTGEQTMVGSWDALLADRWGRAPAVVVRPFPGLLPAPERAFAALVAACDEFRRDSSEPRLRVAIDGGFVLAHMDERLPRANDGSFAGYAARLRAWLGERSFLLTLNDYPAYDPAFWEALRRVLPGVYARVGLPTGGLAANLWVGMYVQTPIGIHTDHADTLWSPLLGRKRLRVWPHPTFAGRRVYRTPGGEHLGFGLDPSLPPGEILEPGPEDMAYWPSSYWHVGESDGGLSVSLSLAFTRYQPPERGPLRLVESELAVLAAASLAGEGAVPEELRLGPSVPVGVVRARQAIASAAASPALDEALTAAWLRRITGLGLRVGPPPRPRIALGDDDVLRGEPAAPVMCAPGGYERTIVAGAGASFMVPADPEIPVLVARLASGAPQRVATLEAAFEPSPPRGRCPRVTIRLLLEQLVRVHALTVA